MRRPFTGVKRHCPSSCGGAACEVGIAAAVICIVATALVYLSVHVSGTASSELQRLSEGSKLHPGTRERHRHRHGVPAEAVRADEHSPRPRRADLAPPKHHRVDTCARFLLGQVCTEATGCHWEYARRECVAAEEREAAQPKKPERTVAAIARGLSRTGASRWIVYQGGLRGQGMGNSLNGLWVAHLLADESKRQVCVDWKDFEEAFQPPGEKGQEACRTTVAESHRGRHVPVLRSWNFGETNTAGEIRQVLAGDSPVVIVEGNEWLEPQWPDVEMGRFLLSYAPTPGLLRYLPAACARPSGLAADRCGVDNVLHLRRGDSKRDKRGVFTCADPIGALKKAFRISNYTVLVDHNELLQKLGVESRNTAAAFHTAGLESWADWVTIATAQRRVFHTPSGFSESAIRVAPHRNHGLGSLETGRLLGECDDVLGIKVEAETFSTPWTRWHNEHPT